MPMDYDDNEFSIHNVELTEEGSSTVSPVLRPYDFEDGGHISFDSLVENEVFLGITGQEDNQWIEEYSHGTSSSVVESRRGNVWSEAASSESVEMLLKSVGQGTLVTESNDEPGCLATNMDPNLKQDDASNHSQEAMVTDKEEEVALATEELDVSDEPCSLSINLDPNLKQEDENKHTQEAMVINKEEEGALATEEMDVSNEPGSLAINMDPNLKQDDGNNHVQEAMVTNKEVGALVTEEMDVSNEPGSLAINMDPNLKQDDGNNHAQEAMVTNKEVGALVTEELDPSDDPCSLNTNIDPSLQQDDGNNHAHEAMIINKLLDHFSGSNVSFNCDKFYGTITKDSQEEAKVFGGELDSDVIGNKCDLSEEIVDDICDDVNHGARNIAVESSENNLHEDLSTSKIECGNSDASKECYFKKCSSSNEPECSTKNIEVGSQTAVETCSSSDEKPSNAESLDKPQFAVDIPIDEEPNPAGSYNLLMTEVCAEVSHDSKCAVGELNNDLMHEDLPPVAVEDDDKTKSENLASLTPKVCSPSKELDVQSWCVEGSEKPDGVFDPSEMCEGSSINDVGTKMTNMCSSPELITGNTDLVATPKADRENSNKDQSPAAKLSGSVPQQVNDEIQSSEQDGGMCIDHNITLNEEGNARLPLELDIAAHDSQQNVESVSSAEGCKAQGSEADTTILAEPGYIDAKSPPILGGAISVNHDNEEKKEEGFVSDGICEYDSLKVVNSMVDCASLSVVETGASPDSAGEGVHGMSVENMNAIMSDLAKEANLDAVGSCFTLSTVDPIPCDSSAKMGDNVEAGGGMQESIPGNHVNMSIEQHASTDAALTSEYNDRRMRHEEDGSVSMDKIQYVSPLLNINNTEVYQSTRVEPSEGAIDDNTSLPVATEDVVLTSECDDRHMRHEEVSSVPMDKLQSVSPLLNTNNAELSQSTRVKPSDVAINENTPLPDVVLTSECDDSHVRRHEEDSSVYKLHSVSLLLNTNNTELSQSTRVKPSEGAINENTSLPEATEDVAFTLECNDSHMRHEEDTSVSMDKLQSVAPLSDTNNTELSENTRVKSSEDAIDENTSLPEATEDVALTSESDNSHMRNEEDGSVSMDKLQSVSPLSDTNNTELSENTRVKSSEGAIDENTSLPQATEDVVLTSECDDSHMRRGEDGSVSMDKLQSASPLLNTNNTDLSWSTGTKHSEGGIHVNTSLPEAAKDVVLTSECDDSHMRHEEDTSVYMGKPISPLSDTNNTELSENTRVKSSEGTIDENSSLPEETEDVVLTSECDDSHMRHEEDGSASMDKLQSVSPLLNTNNTELSRNTGTKHSEGDINEITSLPEAAEDVVLTTECDDSHMRHDEVSSVSMDKLQSVSPVLDTNNNELSQSTRVKPSDVAINENTPLPDVVLTLECDDSHVRRHEDDSSVSMDKIQSVSLINTNNTELSHTSVKSSDGAINENTQLPEATNVVCISECNDSHVRHEEDSCVSMDKLQSVSPLLNTNNNEFSQSTRVKVSEGAINESASLPEATEDVQGKEHSISSKSDLKIDESFTFEVTGTAGLRETCRGMQLFPASQACNLSKTTEVHCIDSSSSTLDSRKLNEAPVVTPQTPGSGTFFSGGKERKTRRKSVGKESVRKGKEAATTRPGRVEKSSPLSATPPQPAAAAAAAAGHDIQFQELGPKEKVECTVTKSIPISNLPDLNSATCTFHQPFTDNQQVQLRAQILVYGSLISGMPPEEPHMIAAFGQSDAGRKAWEDAWHACLERANGQKSHASTPVVQQPRSDIKDLGHRSPDLGIKHSSTLSSANKGSPIAASPLIPVPSPLWNMSTPSCVGLQSRSAAFQQAFTPIHPPSYQTPPNPLWLSQSPFFGQWGVASSPGSAAPRFSGLPITEAVKLTPVDFSGGGLHTYPMPVVHSALFSSQSTDGKKASSESKSRKRKKVTAAFSSVPSQVLMTPPSAHLVPRTGGPNCIPFLLENQTDSVTAPVTSIFSTTVTVSTPSASKSSNPGKFLSVHDPPRLGDKTVGNAEDMLLKKVEKGNVQEADLSATKTWQISSDSRSIKRTKLTTSAAVNQVPVSIQAPPAVAGLPQVLGHEISVLAQNRTIPVTAPAFCTSFPTSVAMSTPVSITSDSRPTSRFSETIYPTVSIHGYPRIGYQNMENALGVEETLSKVKESKLQAENAALLAAAEVSNCQDVWSRLDNQNNSGVVSNAEAKLMSSIAAAVTVAKMASAAAKIALNVAEQAKVMADEVSQSSKTESSGHISHPNVVNKATPASILKSVDKTTDTHPNSIISAAREAARRRIEAASAASKHAENLDAIVKAAELAAEAVSQVGKIVTMGDSSALRKLAEAGPEGFWKISQLAYEQHQGGAISGLHLNSNSGKKSTPDVFIEDIQTLKHGQAPPVHLAHNQLKTVIDGGSITINEEDTRTSKAPNLSKDVGVSTATNTGSPHTNVVGHCIPQNTPGIWDKHNIKEGCLVEVYKEDGKYKGSWLAANVLRLKDEKALVCYTEIQSSDEGLENVKEWVAFEAEGIEEVPRIRIAHPMTTMRFEGARKRRRTAVTDYAWSKGDRVDVWMQDCWREGTVVEPNKIDVTTLTVQFPEQGETSVVRSWHVRPTLIWKDRKWIEWNGGLASQGETPNEKRMRLGSPAAVNDKRKDKLPMIVESGRHEEQRTLLPLLSGQENCFNVGKSTDKPSSNLRTIQKERARVVFGVPKPGKKQKFMAVSTQYVDRNNKNNTTNGSFKFSKPPGARGSKNDATENQVTETKSRVKSRKPPVPWFRTTTSRDSEPTDADSVENSSSRSNQTQVGPSSNKRRDPAIAPPPKKAFTFTSKPKSEQFHRGKLQVAPKIEVKEKSISQVNEPRRSNRKIQPTSRLLEGIQSSLTISKIPSVSHAGQRKVASKGKGSTSHSSS